MGKEDQGEVIYQEAEDEEYLEKSAVFPRKSQYLYVVVYNTRLLCRDENGYEFSEIIQYDDEFSNSYCELEEPILMDQKHKAIHQIEFAIEHSSNWNDGNYGKFNEMTIRYVGGGEVRKRFSEPENESVGSLGEKKHCHTVDAGSQIVGLVADHGFSRIGFVCYSPTPGKKIEKVAD